MTSSPSYVFLTRLVVIKNGRYVYDQIFTRGVNIIRGDNGTGKSTVMDLMYYGLGAELSEWTSPPLSCDKVYVEIEVNTGIYVLSRDIEESGKSPMYIYEGDFQSAIDSSVDWYKYLNRRSDERHSYSQQLFDIMLLPQHKNDDHANLTMHQLLRLVYVDQITAPTKILRYDTVYDSANIRQAIGEYMLGLDDLDVHRLRQELLEDEKSFSKVDGELKAIYRLLGRDKKSFRAIQIQEEINKVDERIKELQQQKLEVRFKKLEDLDENQKLRALNVLEEINSYSLKIERLNSEKNELSSEIVDSTLFLQSIDYRIKSLTESQVTSEYLGGLDFKYCPACLNPIQGGDNHDECGLCKNKHSDGEFRKSHIHMLNELNFQKRESELILKNNSDRFDSVKMEIPIYESLLSKAKTNYSDYLQSSSSIESEISSISTEIGFAESQLESLKERLELSRSIEILIDEKEKLIVSISRTKDLIDQKKEQGKNRYEDVCKNLESSTISIVKKDLDFETDFVHSHEFDFSFPRDRMALNGKSKFSASSMVLLKNSFRLAILLESTKDRGYRFPRILLMDNIEDKGMMPERSHNFQNVMVELCEEIETPYQVIYTTSMISPELDDTEYCRGKFYKRGDHTLEI